MAAVYKRGVVSIDVCMSQEEGSRNTPYVRREAD
jgi:hypothetical protein